MNFPDSITSYFEAANAGNGEAAAACFSEDAIVCDEEAEHRGRSAIRAWVEQATKKYQPQVDILKGEESAGRILVAGRVSGTFPGSPVELKFEFKLENGMIASLRIQ